MTQDNDTTFSLMFELGRLIRSRIEKSASLLSVMHFETLRFVHDKTRPNMRDIAKYLHVTAPSATALIDELTRAGYLRRESDVKDRRQIRLTMTDKGANALGKNTTQRTHVLRDILQSLSRNDRREFNRILHKILVHS